MSYGRKYLREGLLGEEGVEDSAVFDVDLASEKNPVWKIEYDATSEDKTRRTSYQASIFVLRSGPSMARRDWVS